MKYVFSIIGTLCLFSTAWGQEPILKDFDKDKMIDTVVYDPAGDLIICKLSSLKYEPLISRSLVTFTEDVGVRDHKDGFEFYQQWEHSGVGVVFSFNKKKNDFQAISISRNDKGDSNTGHLNGGSMLQLKTDQYSGSWEYWDQDSMKLMTYPTIKMQLKYPSIYLTSFDITYITNFVNDCKAIVHEYAANYQKPKPKVKKK